MTTTIRDLQLKELEILKEFHRICEEENLTYYLSSGTLLGAVRHQGFIPWDDDIDVCMPVKDYKRFCKIAPSKLSSRFYFQNHITDDNYFFAFSKIRMNHTTCIHRLYRYHQVHQGIWIDIFPLVETTGSTIDMKLKNKMIKIGSAFQFENYLEGVYKEYCDKFGKVTIWGVKLVSKLPLRVRKDLHSLFNNLAYYGRNRGYYTEVFSDVLHYVPKEAFEGEPAKLRFEGECFYAPANYDLYLKYIFGDYMKLPPENERVNHTADGGIIDLDKDYTYYIPSKLK